MMDAFRPNSIYRRESDGHRFLFDRDPGTATERKRLDLPEFYQGWTALGPDLFGMLVGTPGNWPVGYVYEGPAVGNELAEAIAADKLLRPLTEMVARTLSAFDGYGDKDWDPDQWVDRSRGTAFRYRYMSRAAALLTSPSIQQVRKVAWEQGLEAAVANTLDELNGRDTPVRENPYKAES